MSEVSIKLDLKVVQAAIHAKVQPAVDAILKKVDLPALIEAELKKKVPQGAGSHLSYMIYSMGGGPARPLIDSLVTEAIAAAAKSYIKGAVAKDKEKIDTAFKKMLADSPNKLANMLHASLIDALDNAWSFDMQTTITPREPERDYDRD